MPYLRYSRDKRGYEHTYVLHGSRAGGRPRVLYWFRTPPNVAVGRDALDDDAMRAIESGNPDLMFDWDKMRQERPKPPPRPGAGAARSPKWRRVADRAGRRRSGESPPEPRPALDPAPAPGPEVAAADPTDADPAPAPAVAAASPEHPVAALLGDAMLESLRARYAELVDLVAARDLPAPRGAELASRLQALDPDRWQAGEDVVLGLERFDGEAAAVRAALDDMSSGPRAGQ